VQSDAGLLKVVWGDGPQLQCEAAYKLDKEGKNQSDFSRVKVMCLKPEVTKEAMNQTGSPQTAKP
jgi:hypothetical protein